MTDPSAAKAPPDRVLVGTRVTLALVNEDGAREEMVVELVEQASADLAAGRLGLATPMAQAIVGRKPGTTVPYTRGDIRHLEIVRVEWVERSPEALAEAERAAQARREAVEHARQRAAKTLTDNVASSMSNKWGSYEVPDED